MQASKPLNRRVAIVLALVGMWLASSIGVFIVLNSGEWYFISLRGYDVNTLVQIGTFYSLWAVAQFPGACIAGAVISLSDFRRPLWTTFLTMASYEILVSIIRGWPWKPFHALNQSVPILAYVIAILSLIGVSVFFTWFNPRFHRLFRRFSMHLVNRKS